MSAVRARAYSNESAFFGRKAGYGERTLTQETYLVHTRRWLRCVCLSFLSKQSGLPAAALPHPQHRVRHTRSKTLLVALVLYTFTSVCWISSCQPWCKYDFSISPEEAKKRDCGYACPDPWGAEDPHSCGPPHPCCCAPKCDMVEARKNAFIGINWSDKYSKLKISRPRMFEILKRNGFKHIKLFSPDGIASILQVYGRDVHLYVALPNRMLTELASDPASALRIIQTQIRPYSDVVRLLVVGNEPLLCVKTTNWAAKQECGSLNIPAKLLPAMQNVKKALTAVGLADIPVTTAFNGGILEMSKNPWTPCVADYREVVKPILRKVWSFLEGQKPPAPFMVNLYSWFASMGGHIPPDISVGVPAESGNIPSDGVYKYYFNFDMQVEMQRVAMCKNNVTHLDLWIGETGWPTAGSPRATLTNAYFYMKHVVMRAQGMSINNATLDNIRTRGMAYPIFLFEAFDEMFKFEIEHGNKFENSFGLFYENGLPKWYTADGLLDLPLPRLEQRPEHNVTTAGQGPMLRRLADDDF
ncbi:glycosyl hydrolases family 17 protein [Cystoisospora suis]|uniref:Glycosyl hydrolases family 17 protein n=1 Tax=Cystoisospora suis TaxID=483139 RepID=A0A2C6KYH9_9APIC|nr:glycosyl hydrolases family 17 protein [Cystoisospora suis]